MDWMSPVFFNDLGLGLPIQTGAVCGTREGGKLHKNNETMVYIHFLQTHINSKYVLLQHNCVRCSVKLYSEC